MGSLYHWLYSRIGGKPWTYIMRGWVAGHALESLALAVLVGVMLGKVFTIPALVYVGVITAIGVLIGHLFWSTRGSYLGN